MQLPTPRYSEGVWCVRVLHAQRDVALQLAIQPLAQLPAGHVLALAPGQGRIVDQHVDRDGRLLDRDARQPVEMIRRGHGFPNFDTGKPGNGDDLARRSRLEFHTLKTLECKKLHHARLLELAVAHRTRFADRQ